MAFCTSIQNELFLQCNEEARFERQLRISVVFGSSFWLNNRVAAVFEGWDRQTSRSFPYSKLHLLLLAQFSSAIDLRVGRGARER